MARGNGGLSDHVKAAGVELIEPSSPPFFLIFYMIYIIMHNSPGASTENTQCIVEDKKRHEGQTGGDYTVEIVKELKSERVFGGRGERVPLRNCPRWKERVLKRSSQITCTHLLSLLLSLLPFYTHQALYIPRSPSSRVLFSHMGPFFPNSHTIS